MQTEITDICAWLIPDCHEVSDKKFYHVLLVEDVDKRASILGELRAYVREAHEPAFRFLRAPFENSLHPGGAVPATKDAADGYPYVLEAKTLTGYLGEVLAGAVAEGVSLPGIDACEVPVFLFHSHDVALQELERLAQVDGSSKVVPGRTGDDCLAFSRNASGEIVKVIACEAKLLSKHDSGKMKSNHKKLAEGPIRPVDIARVIEALKLLDDCKENRDWILALQTIYFDENFESFERLDLSCYAVGTRPKLKKSWIDRTGPVSTYTADRWLVSVEVHVEEVHDLVESIYDKEVFE